MAAKLGSAEAPPEFYLLKSYRLDYETFLTILNIFFHNTSLYLQRSS